MDHKWVAIFVLTLAEVIFTLMYVHSKYVAVIYFDS